MTTREIKTPRQFLEDVVDPDVADFVNDRTNLRLAYHACWSLISLRDWIAKSYKGSNWKIGSASQSAFQNEGDLQTALCRINPLFKAIAAVANASKHMVYDKIALPLKIEDVNSAPEIEKRNSALFGAAAFGTVLFNQSPAHIDRLRVRSGVHPPYDVAACIESAHVVWHELFDENSW
jgi:hypothetical protein